MAERYFPFASVNGDRKAGIKEWTDYFGSILTPGVFPDGDSLMTRAAGGMKVSLSAGKGHIGGSFYYNDDPKIFTLDPADGTLNRADRIVMRWSRADRWIKSFVKKGTPGVTAVPPPLQWDEDIKERGLCLVSINAGITSITQTMIQDTRPDETVCGFVSSLVKLDSKAWFAQFEAIFMDWWEQVKVVMDDETAGELMNAVMAIRYKTADIVAQIVNETISLPSSAWVDNTTAGLYELTFRHNSITPEKRVKVILDDACKGLYSIFALDPQDGKLILRTGDRIEADLTGRLIVEEVRP